MLVKHGFPSTRDVYLMHGSNGVFLPRGCNGTIFFILAPRPKEENINNVVFFTDILEKSAKTVVNSHLNTLKHCVAAESAKAHQARLRRHFDVIFKIS